jgi:CYTH domain-containing protein
MSISIEHERRFLVKVAPEMCVKIGEIQQGYLYIGKRLEFRVRMGSESRFGIKYRVGAAKRVELEFSAPKWFLGVAFKRCKYRVHKSRSALLVEGRKWEIDQYHGELQGLVTAEVELQGRERLSIPDWVGDEITDVAGWSNKELSRYGLPK